MSTMLRESMLRESMLRESMLREPVVDRLTRRRLLGGSVGLLGAGVLAACSGTGPAPATGEVRTVEGTRQLAICIQLERTEARKVGRRGGGSVSSHRFACRIASLALGRVTTALAPTILCPDRIVHRHL